MNTFRIYLEFRQVMVPSIFDIFFFSISHKGIRSLPETQVFESLYFCNQMVYTFASSNFISKSEFVAKTQFLVLLSLSFLLEPQRIYQYREELTQKRCKTAILLYCFHTAGVLHIFVLYNLLGPGISFYRKSKIIVKSKTKL